ncbi:hypothetical protein [Falsiporphyromonas endometrii]|uniref:Uncharacterized protein n=1 Tax=Falsiporphyromonas endometrii TaxID=1387297 RepID=A0ABV9K6N5_9PORP|nr:hypothetical protein [Porphyromonadaceae bacterium]
MNDDNMNTSPFDMDDDEPCFGGQNFRAPRLGLGRVVQYFPWTEYLNACGYDGVYPSMIYMDDNADEECQQTMQLLAVLVASHDAWYSAELYFGEVKKEGLEEDKRGVLTLGLNLPELSLDAEKEQIFRRSLLRAIALYYAHEESYGHEVTLTQESEYVFILS